MNPDALHAALAPLIDTAGLIPGAQADERFCRDWSGARSQPLMVLRPRDTAEVSRVLAVLHDLRQPVVLQGGMTGLVGACVPQPGEVVLSLERLRSMKRSIPSRKPPQSKPVSACRACRKRCRRRPSCSRWTSAAEVHARSAG